MNIRKVPLALLLAIAGTAEANTYVVTRFDDPSGTSCTASNCSLRAALAAANAHGGSDTIKLAKGEYCLTLGGPFGPSSPLVVTDRVAIVGVDARSTQIRQTLAYRVFTVQATALELDSLAVLDGRAQGAAFPANAGGCLYADHGSVTLRGAILANCTAADAGGALYLDGGRATLAEQSLIELNAASRGGGVALGALDAALTLSSGSQLYRNQAPLGGAAFAQVGTVNPDGSITHPGVLVMSADSSIGGNAATWGGALAVAFGKRLNVSLASADLALPGAMASIAGNRATNGAGGGIYSVGDLDLHRVRLSGNASANGGALYLDRGDPNGVCPLVTIGDSEIVGNAATGDGGGIDGRDGLLIVDGASFNANTAGGSGGAIAYQSGDALAAYPCFLAEASLRNVSISNNAAQFGGGVFVGAGDGHMLTDATLDVRYSTFFNNHASALAASSDVEVDNRTIDFGQTTENAAYTGSSLYSDGCFYRAAVTSDGGNRDTSAGSCVPIPLASDQVGVSAAALGLGYGAFGGPFPVVGFTLATSPAVGAGTGACPVDDVRGAPRPATGCNSGAFELGATPP